jgi:hypothetical protein
VPYQDAGNCAFKGYYPIDFYDPELNVVEVNQLI